MNSRKNQRRQSVKNSSGVRAAAAAVPLRQALLETLENRCLLSAVVTTGAAGAIWAAR